MAFLTQNDLGTVDGANSYVTLAELVDYMADRGYTTTKTDTEKEQALVLATDFLDNNHKFTGVKTNGSDQTTKLPVIYCKEITQYPCYCSDTYYDSVNSGITTDIKNATFEYFLAIDAGTILYRNINPADTGISKESKKVGPLSKTTEYSGTKGSTNTGIVPNAENFLERSGLLLYQGNHVFRS